MFFGLGVKAQDLTGSWKCSDGVIINVIQTGTNISLTIEHGGYKYQGAGFIRNSNVVHIIIIGEGNSCIAKYSDKWKIKSDGTMDRLTECIDGGSCDVKRTATSILTRSED